jgi:lipopolysaccharide transport system ATP-binding protein
MSQVAIRGVGLGKRYAIGERVRYVALRDTLANAIKRSGRLFSPNHKNNSSRREHIWALRDASFEVQEGEVVGLVGRNGAGKTTLLKILSRVTLPTIGFAEVHGRMGTLLEVGTGFHPELTGRENVFLSGAILGMSKREMRQKFDEMVAFAEVEKFIDTPLKHYSTGMQMRLAFSVAAHLEPEILLVDEVLAVGDASFQKKCLGKMGDVSRQGRTIIFVSHNMTALRSLCTRALWLSEGKIIETGAAGEVIDHYLRKNTVSKLESLWEEESTAPGDHQVRLRGVRVIPGIESSDNITVRTPLRIEFTYWNYVPDEVLNVSMILNNLEEVCVFNIASDFAPRPVGLICHVVEIPGGFLNTGSYYVNLMVVRNSSTVILRQDNVVAFEVVEGEAEGQWYGQRPGVVRPLLTWKTVCIERRGDFTLSAKRQISNTDPSSNAGSELKGQQ